MYFKKKCHPLGEEGNQYWKVSNKPCALKKIFCNLKSDKSSYCIFTATEKVKLEVDAQAALQIHNVNDEFILPIVQMSYVTKKLFSNGTQIQQSLV